MKKPNIDILTDPEPEMIIVDPKDIKISFGGHEVIGYTTSKEIVSGIDTSMFKDGQELSCGYGGTIFKEPGRVRTFITNLKKFRWRKFK
jgi:hypothetical protein